MDESKVLWCSKSARKPVEQPSDSPNRRGLHLHEYCTEDGRVLRCYLDHDGECDFKGSDQPYVLRPHWV